MNFRDFLICNHAEFVKTEKHNNKTDLVLENEQLWKEQIKIPVSCACNHSDQIYCLEMYIRALNSNNKKEFYEFYKCVGCSKYLIWHNMIIQMKDLESYKSYCLKKMNRSSNEIDCAEMTKPKNELRKLGDENSKTKNHENMQLKNSNEDLKTNHHKNVTFLSQNDKICSQNNQNDLNQNQKTKDKFDEKIKQITNSKNHESSQKNYSNYPKF